MSYLVLLSFRQHRGPSWPGWHGLRGKGLIISSVPENDATDRLTSHSQYVGYWLAYTLPTCVFFISPLILWYGHGKYRTSPPTGSVLPTALRIWRYASRGRWSWNPIKTVQNLTAEDFWESAKPSKVVGKKPEWMRYDDNWVDELRRGFKACFVFMWFPIYGASGRCSPRRV